MFFQASVEIEVETSKGIKTVRETYLVDAETVTEAEALMYKEFTGFPQDWKVTRVAQTRILKVVTADTAGTIPKEEIGSYKQFQIDED